MMCNDRGLGMVVSKLFCSIEKGVGLGGGNFKSDWYQA